MSDHLELTIREVEEQRATAEAWLQELSWLLESLTRLRDVMRDDKPETGGTRNAEHHTPEAWRAARDEVERMSEPDDAEPEPSPPPALSKLSVGLDDSTHPTGDNAVDLDARVLAVLRGASGPVAVANIATACGLTVHQVGPRLRRLKREKAVVSHLGNFYGCWSLAEASVDQPSTPPAESEATTPDEFSQPLESFLHELPVGRRVILRATQCATPLDLANYGATMLRGTSGAGSHTVQHVAEWLKRRFDLVLAD